MELEALSLPPVTTVPPPQGAQRLLQGQQGLCIPYQSRPGGGSVSPDPAHTLPSLGPSGLGQGTEARVMGGRAGGGLEEGSAGGPMTKILHYNGCLEMAGAPGSR